MTEEITRRLFGKLKTECENSMYLYLTLYTANTFYKPGNVYRIIRKWQIPLNLTQYKT